MCDFLCFLKTKSEGSVLVIAMMALVILTLIGIAASTTSNIESQISTNDFFSKIAFYNAESILNLVTEDLAECVNEHQAYPANARVEYLQADGTAGGTADQFYQEAIDPTLHDAARDLRIVLNNSAAEVDISRSGVTVEAGGGSEFSGVGESSTPSSTFVYYDLTAEGQGPRDARYNIQAGNKILVSNQP